MADRRRGPGRAVDGDRLAREQGVPVMFDNLESLSREELAAHLKVARRAHAVARARENLLPFIKITMPDPERYDDPQASAYRDVAHHRLLCEAFEKVERGECPRLAVSSPPQHGQGPEERWRGKEWVNTSRALVTGVQTCALPI